ncbi:CMRF35-like molecule 5 [Dissostichus eleginoides]|uniref:CMRF35-like molecule 5 n=1 Tax=Dissostichus eleginoides TaxID=100907 RepID=A0AAD9C346_DISEL|nr:CMRF35-like molecule 5 [Dissostichus eleginoides]
MAEEEEEVNYASVVFKAGHNPPPAAKRGEDTVYGEVKVQNERKNKDSAGHRCFQHLACCLGILCVILLGGIIGVCVYRVEELKTGNQELETKTNNLTQQIQDMTTNWNELNVSRAQWSIDSYCLGNTDKKCQPCQFGWFLSQPSCYAINNPHSPEEITEEADYVNAPEGPADKKATRPEDTKKEAAPEGTVDTKASPPGLRFFLPIAVCWIILLAIMGLRIYFTSELSEDNAKQTAEILNLTSRIQELETWKNLTVRWDNLTQAFTVLESNVKNLNKLNQELETKKNNLTQQKLNMETNWNELNISQAQWSIDSYCLGNTDDKCQPCQFGWFLSQPSCYAINDPPSPALSFVEMKPLNIRGCVGERVTFTCSDWNTVFGSDANTYYCGVKRNGPDPWIKVNLKVTDATSYGSIPYLIIGVILIITILMVLLKFMSKKMMKQRKVVSTAVMPQEDAREEAEYDEIRHEEATDPDSLYANNSFLQDIGSAAAGCETNSRGACAESRDNVLYSVAQLPKDQMKPTGQSQRNQSESAENDSFYDLVQLPQAP